MEHTWTYISTIALMLVGFLLIFIILLQRGRGGGLAGAFGGLGGQSAFGTKAGDVFTKITIVLAVVWVALAGLSGFAMLSEDSHRF
ncbi:MAG: preprotein translocase subunit SecG, partial [Planctomycetes bacterium]|nr:preprotein translocase subunit SecG [Planctomycetota bacterium]